MLTSNEQSSLFSIFKASFGNESTALVVSLSFALKKFILVQFSLVFLVAFIDMPVVSLISVTNFSQTFEHHRKSNINGSSSQEMSIRNSKIDWIKVPEERLSLAPVGCDDPTSWRHFDVVYLLIPSPVQIKTTFLQAYPCLILSS